MSATSVVAVRLDTEIRRRTQAVLRQEHLSDSTFIRRMYAYVAKHGKVPDFIWDVEYDGIGSPKRPDRFDDLCAWIRESPYSSMDFSFLSDESVAQTLGAEEGVW